MLPLPLLPYIFLAPSKHCAGWENLNVVLHYIIFFCHILKVLTQVFSVVRKDKIDVHHMPILRTQISTLKPINQLFMNPTFFSVKILINL